MTPSQIAKTHFAAAMAPAKADGQDLDAVARAFLPAAVTSFLERRRVADVRTEILSAADNVDPDTDYMFMRP